jgi:hypothetical protein
LIKLEPLFFLEERCKGAAYGADQVFWEALESRAWAHPVLWVYFRRIVDVYADGADTFIHILISSIFK